ncbi:serine/threonine-protein kinase Nek1-like isoform X1 [Apostichopus japonicus]|uniref:serine/threonine-protein kinase Nek1-like isoform X1 n=1 Tax=Stichopus japonicus TaxID=307972 RepID=UPI003AB1F969
MALARGPYSQSIHGYRKIKKIGKGGFGTVYLVTKGGQRYALKEIVQEAESEKEVQILKNLKHVNIVSYIESFPGGLNKLYIVMEYCEMGNLRELIISKDPIGVEERFIVGIMTQVCRGMKYIHRKKVIHRDIKPPNVLATSRGDFKVGDFGLSKVLQSGGYTKTRCGTHGYISPECLAGLPYTFSSDMWAVGKVLSDLCSYKGKQDYSNDLRALNQNLLSREPRKRPTADEALSMLSNVNSASKGRHLSRVASPKGYPKYLRALLGKLQTDPSYQPTTDDIRTVFLNLNIQA